MNENKEFSSADCCLLSGVIIEMIKERKPLLAIVT